MSFDANAGRSLRLPDKNSEIVVGLTPLAREIGLDGEKFQQCLNSGKQAARVLEDVAEGLIGSNSRLVASRLGELLHRQDLGGNGNTAQQWWGRTHTVVPMEAGRLVRRSQVCGVHLVCRAGGPLRVA